MIPALFHLLPFFIIQTVRISLILSVPILDVKMKTIFFTWYLGHLCLASLLPVQSIPNSCLSIQGHTWSYVVPGYLSCLLSHLNPSSVLWAFPDCQNDLWSSHFQVHCTPWQKSLSPFPPEYPLFSYWLILKTWPLLPESPQSCKHIIRLYVIHL